ncbi:MAG: signal peptide peptidase SppA, partial [Myxococcota bacterium]|nr:signal peptide peptidase SppA [Myxococcota bacterium]
EVVDTIDRLAEQDSVKAVVLAVNSPGGSALASDLIARSVQALDDRKPVVAVMGNVAASGGYYISAVAREIVAHPATITGSIGVVGGKVVLGKALARLGIHTTWMGPAPDPGLLSPEAPFSPDQRIRFRASLKRVYRRFIDVVAKGRGLDIDAVESVAQGRVWTGTQALDRGLVDRLGSLSLGIERAAALAELGDGRIKTVPVRFNPPAFAVVNQLMGAQAASIDARVASMAGADGLLVHALAIDAGKPLMMLPTVLDQGAWRTWTGSP